MFRTASGESRRTDVRNAFLCAAAVTAAFFLVNPFVETPFDDDWSYAFAVRQFLRSGRMIYNGGSAPMLIAHVYWGAMFAKILGFSIIVLRLSTLPMAAASAALCYILARQAGLRPSLAIFTSLLLCFSPLFLPLATSFMTDVPAACFALGSLIALIHSARMSSGARAVGWLIFGCLVGAIGGTSRQIVWVVPLTILPYLCCLRRRDPIFAACTAILWLLIIVEAFAMIHWFNRQPYAVVVTTMLLPAARTPGFVLTMLMYVLLTIVLLTLPAALFFAPASLAAIWRQRRHISGAVSAMIAIALSAALIRNPALTIEPYLGDIVTTQGAMGGLELSGARPVAQPIVLRELLSACVTVVFFILLNDAVCWLILRRKIIRRLVEFFFPADQNVALPAMALFAVAYLFLLLQRAPTGLEFDRYTLPLIPIATIIFLRRYPSVTDRPTIRSIKPAAYCLLAIYGLYGLAVTQDELALGRARMLAIKVLEDHGIPPTRIAAGLERDAWVQVNTLGHINSFEIRNPPHAFNPNEGPFPALKCKYRLEFQPQSDTIPSEFGSIPYTSWLPPFHRRIFIDQFRNPWWLNPRRPPLPPDPRQYETFTVY
jgi:hypothetical protein